MDEVKRLRLEKGWSQNELAYHAKLAPSVISLIETGKRDPNATTLRKLAEALEVEVRDLFPPGQAYFVPLEEGEEEDTVTLEIHYVWLFNGREPILQAVRKASADEEAAMRQELEKSGRTRE